MSNTRNYIWSAINRFGSQLIAFGGNVLIARLLTPDDYGLVAMLSIVLSISLNFTDAGFADCLIRKADADNKDYGTVFTYNVVMGVILYLVVFAFSPLIANFFGRPELIAISRILGLSILIKALTITEFTRLRKNLKFKTTTLIDVSSSIVSLFFAYAMAIGGYGYWALVFQALSIGVSNIFFLFVLARWKPFFYFSWSRFKNMSGYSFNLLISYLTNQIGQNLYSVVIGKYNSTTALGYYQQAQKFRDTPLLSLNAIILTTSYPLLAKELDEKERYKMYASLLSKFCFIYFLICFILLGSAHPLISILLGDRWLPSIEIFQLLIISFLLIPFTTVNSNIAKVQGYSKLYRNLTFIRNGLLFMALLLTMKQSISIILYGQIIAWYISSIIDIIYCGRIINFGLLKQLKILFFQITPPSISLVLSYISSYYIVNSLFRISVFISVFLAVYILINELINNKIYNIFKTKLIESLKRYF